jgi:hypothetical protein
MIEAGSEPRFVVRIEVDAVLESEPTDRHEEDRDYLKEIEEAIEAMDLDE